MDILKLQEQARNTNGVVMERSFGDKTAYKVVKVRYIKLWETNEWKRTTYVKAPVMAAKVVTKEVIEPTENTESDLKVIDGIGAAVEKELKKNGITTLTELSETTVEQITEILAKKKRLARYDPTDWAAQATFLTEAK